MTHYEVKMPRIDSWVLPHYEEDDKNSVIVRCRICGKQIFSNHSTSAMNKHLHQKNIH